MGRYKRHQQKNRTTTTTIVADRPQQISIAERKPQISERVNYQKKERGKLISNFVGEVLFSIKKRNLYADFLCAYNPNFKLEDNNSLISEAHYLFFNSLCTYHIGDKVVYYPKLFPAHLINEDALYKSLLFKIILLNAMIYPKYRKSKTRPLPKNILTEYYVTDELEKRNKKIYPNELYLSFLFGVTFSVIWLIVISSILGQIFGMWATCVFSFFVVVCLLIWMIK